MDEFDKIDDGMDEFGIDDDMFGEPKADNRKPITKTLDRAKAGIKNSIKEKRMSKEMGQLAGRAMTKAMGQEAESLLGYVKSGIMADMDKHRKEIRENSEDAINFLDKAIGKSKIGKMTVDGIKKLLGTSETSSSGKSTDTQANEMAESIFGKSQIDLASIELNKESLKATNESNQHSYEQTNLIKYSAGISEKYYKKSIELKYKTLFELKAIKKQSASNLITTESLLRDIVKNTGLPEATKIKIYDSLKTVGFTNMSDNFYKGIGKTSIGDTISKGLRRKLQSTTDGITSALGMTSMLGMMDGMGGMGSREEQDAMSKQGMAANMATDGILSKVKGGVSNFLSEKVLGSKKGAQVRQFLDRIVSDPNRYLQSKADNLDEGMTKGLFNFMADITASEKKGSKVVSAGSLDLNEVGRYTVRTDNTINQTIPSLLSKILKEVTILSTGDKDTKELKYDHSRGEFIDGNSVGATIRGELSNVHNNRNSTQVIMKQISELEKLSGIKLDKKERGVLVRSLLNQDHATLAGYVNDEMDDGFLKGADPKTRMKISSMINNANNANFMDKDGTVKIDHSRGSKANDALRGIYSTNIDLEVRITELIKSGYGDDLRKIGLVKFNKTNNTYTLIDKKMKEFNSELLTKAIIEIHDHESYVDKIDAEIEIEKTQNKKKESFSDKLKRKIKDEISPKVNIDIEKYKNKVTDLYDKADKQTILKYVDDLKDHVNPEQIEEIKKHINSTYDDVVDVFDNIKNEGFEKAKNIKESETLKDMKEKTKISVSEYKEKITNLYDDLDKSEILSKLDNMKGHVNSKQVDELKKYVEESYDNVSSIFDTVKKSETSKLVSITDKDKTIEEKLSELSNTHTDKIKDTLSTFDVKSKGKNFFDKVGDAVADSVNGVKKKKKKYDKDGDGDRDGSWMDILSNKKKGKGFLESKTKSKFDKNNSDKASGLMGILGSILGPIGGILGSMVGIGGGMSIAAIGGLLMGGVVSVLKLGFKSMIKVIGLGLMGVGSILKLILRTTMMGNMMPGGGKFKSIMNAMKRNKGKLALGAGALALFYGTDAKGDDDMGIDDDFMGTNGMISQTMNDFEESQKQDNSTSTAIAGATGGVIGGKVLHSAYKKTKANKKKMDKDVKATKEIAKKFTNTSLLNKAAGKIFAPAALAMGGMQVADDIGNGDYARAALHTVSTMMSLIPILGIPLSIAADMAVDNMIPPSSSEEKEEDYQNSRTSYNKSKESRQSRRSNPKNIKMTQTASRGSRRSNPKNIKMTTSKHIIQRGFKAKFRGKIKKGDRILLEEISKYESAKGPAGYNKVYSKYKGKLNKQLTTMTVEEVSQLQAKMVSSGSTAVGKYQFIVVTFDEIRKKMKLPNNTIFSPETQDMMIITRLNYMRGYEDWKSGGITDSQFLDKLSMEFASIPNSKGVGHYDGVNGNKSLTSPLHMYSVLQRVREALGMVTLTTPEEYKDQQNKAEEISTGTIETSSNGSKSEGLIASAIKAVLEFFGESPETGDSSIKPNVPEPKYGTGNYTDTDDSTTTKPSDPNVQLVSHHDFCGLKINRLAAIPKAISKAGNKRFKDDKPTNLVIHNTAGSSLNLDRMKKDGYGTQFWIDKKGVITLIGDPLSVIYHVGPRRNEFKHVNSGNSIGIEMVCPYQDRDKRWAKYTEAQTITLSKLVKCIQMTYKIPKNKVFYHYQVSYKTKDEGKEGWLIAQGINTSIPEEISGTADSFTPPEATKGQVVTNYIPPKQQDERGDSNSHIAIVNETSKARSNANMDIMQDVNRRQVNSTGSNTSDITIKVDNAFTNMLGTQVGHLANMDNTLLNLLEVNKAILDKVGGESNKVRNISKKPIDSSPIIDMKTT